MLYAPGVGLIYGRAYREAETTSISTPIKLKHWIVYHVYFSVHGQEWDGSSMAVFGPGALRMVVREKETFFPSVSICLNYLK